MLSRSFAVGVPPEEFFERPMAPPLWRSEISEAAASRMAFADTLPPSMRDASPLVQALVLLLANKGMLSVDELQDVQHAVTSNVSGSAGGTPKR